MTELLASNSRARDLEAEATCPDVATAIATAEPRAEAVILRDLPVLPRHRAGRPMPLPLVVTISAARSRDTGFFFGPPLYLPGTNEEPRLGD